MKVEDMIFGYTIYVATQFYINDRKGSIETGKDADYIIINENLFNEEPSMFSQLSPSIVWFEGKIDK